MKRFPTARTLAHFAILAVLAAPLAAAPPVFDEIVAYQFAILGSVRLPGGPTGLALPASQAITSLVALPSGRTLAATVPSLPDGTTRLGLNELLADGSLRRLGDFGPPPTAQRAERIVDMALDGRGRLYALVSINVPFEPPTTRLARLDPATGAELGTIPVPLLDAIATARDGLWALSEGYKLQQLDPDSGELGTLIRGLGLPGETLDVETDSAGILWKLDRSGTPPVQSFAWLDLTTGQGAGPYFLLNDRLPAIETFTIRRRCYESDTVRCLQDGRFRAEVTYRGYDGAAGSARVTPARSRDSAIFSFFHPDNWELMVKALDGCNLNDHFWVYAAASTDVEYAMTITDTQTGEQKVYSNALGQVAATVTDNLAFSCP